MGAILFYVLAFFAVAGGLLMVSLKNPLSGAFALILSLCSLAGLFAIFHGHAHGTEMPQDAAALSYAAGFMLATALLHGAGIAIGLVAGRLAEHGGWRVAQAAGGAMALAGIALLANAG